MDFAGFNRRLDRIGGAIGGVYRQVDDILGGFARMRTLGPEDCSTQCGSMVSVIGGMAFIFRTKERNSRTA